jgi:hypothetical protein
MDRVEPHQQHGADMGHVSRFIRLLYGFTLNPIGVFDFATEC